MCIFKVLIGSAIIVGAIAVEIAWLGLCFGTVIVGIVLLIFAPHILIAPFSIGMIGGLALIASCNDSN